MSVHLEIESLAAGGDGVARADGLVVFVPRTAPGDLVEAEVTVKGRVGRGSVVRIERAGAARVTPRCAHFAAPARCGGCQWQQVSIDEQRRAKARLVEDAFARIAKRPVVTPEVEGGEPWRYRRSLTLSIRRAGGRVWAGLRAFDDPEEVFDLADCEITDARVVAAWREIVAAERSLPAGARLRGTVRLLDDATHFTLEGGDAWSSLESFLRAVPSLAAVWWLGEGRRRQLVADRRSALLPGSSFAQVNAEMATRLQQHVRQLVMAYAPATVIDGYSGAGDLAAELHGAGVMVTALELDEEAVAFASTRLAAPSRVVAARVEDVLARVLPADVVVLNPPRAGVDARVIAAIRAAQPTPRAVIYVSCDPATLARDVGRLDGWRVKSLRCFDLFPQTSHVESVCELVPEGA